jgi:hypothetical protein
LPDIVAQRLTLAEGLEIARAVASKLTEPVRERDGYYIR